MLVVPFRQTGDRILEDWAPFPSGIPRPGEDWGREAEGGLPIAQIKGGESRRFLTQTLRCSSYY
jgi:hypothetical protein